MLESDFASWFYLMANGNDKWQPEVFFEFKISDADRRTKPFDAFGMMWWVWLAIEFKKVDWLIAYPYKELRWSSPKNPWWQVLWLTRWQKNGGLSLVIVYSRQAQKFMVFDFKDLTLDSKYIFDA